MHDTQPNLTVMRVVRYDIDSVIIIVAVFRDFAASLHKYIAELQATSAIIAISARVILCLSVNSPSYTVTVIDYSMQLTSQWIERHVTISSDNNISG